MHYDEQRENDIINVSKSAATNVSNKSADKIKVILPYSPSITQHLTITWHLDEIAKTVCNDLIKKPKENI